MSLGWDSSRKAKPEVLNKFELISESWFFL